MTTPYSGYHDCPCRDCFDVAIGGLPVDRDGDHVSGDLEGVDVAPLSCRGDRVDSYDDARPGLCHACQCAGCSPEGDSECSVEPDDDDDDDEHDRGGML